MNEKPLDHWNEIRKLHVEYAPEYRLFGGIVLVVLGIGIGVILFGEHGWLSNDGYTTNLYTELISIGVTVFIIDFLNRQRDERRQIEEYQYRLFQEIRSPEPIIAHHAIHKMREQGWLWGKNSLLKGTFIANTDWTEANLTHANLKEIHLYNVNLAYADLAGVDLSYADLRTVNFRNVNLREANLERSVLGITNTSKFLFDFSKSLTKVAWITNEFGLKKYDDFAPKPSAANLIGANLSRANLSGAYLAGVDFENVKLFNTNLANANLIHANFKGVSLMGCNLIGANLEGVEFDEGTALPDYEPFINEVYWKSGTEMSRYTNPDDPNFWKADWVNK